MSRRLPLLLLVVFASTFASNSFAEWQPNGVAAGTDSSYQTIPKLVSDGAGGAIVTWLRNFNDISVQRVSAAGIPLWFADGVALTASPDIRDAPAIASDGAGGAIVTWQDYRNSSPDIYAQRVDASGVPQWTVGGVQICNAAADQLFPAIVPDGAGGAIIAWQDYRLGTADVFARRVDSSGVAQGGSGGVAISTNAGDQENLAMISDGAGGAIIAWEDYRIGTADIFAQRVNSSIISQWAAGGLAVCIAANTQGRPTIATDGAAGAIVAWWDTRGGDGDIYAQRVNAAGAAQWAANGAGICTDPGEQGSWLNRASPTIATDGAGGAIVAWGDSRNASPDIYAQRVNAAGAAQWAGNGVSIASGSVSGPLGNPVIVPDGTGGAVVGWLVTYDSGMDFFAQRVTASGAEYWAAGGIPLTYPENDRNYLEMVADGAQGAIVAWSDSRNSNINVFASIINGNTPAGSNVVVSPVDRTTGGTPVTVTFDDVSNGSTTLVTGPVGPALPGAFALGDGKYYHLSTTATVNGNIEVCITYNESALTVPEAAMRMLHYDAAQALWVDITTSLDTVLNRICGVTTSLSPFVIGAGSATAVGDGTVPARLALRQNFPNPFNPETVIAFDVPAGGANVRIQIYDAAGRRVRSLVERHFAPGVHTVGWNGRDDAGRDAASGVYFCRMDANSFQQTRKMVLLR